jgi:hypothetical protein
MERRVWLAVPLLLLAAIVAYLLLGRPLADLTASAPPVEELVVENVALTPGMISLNVRGDGSDPITIAQVQVDGGWRVFTATPSPTVGRLGTTRIDVPYRLLKTCREFLLWTWASSWASSRNGICAFRSKKTCPSPNS